MNDRNFDLNELNKLTDLLHDTLEKIQVLTGGEIDAVIHPKTGKSYLLNQAQSYLREQESIQRNFANIQRAILNSIPANIALLDNQGNISDVNEAWENYATKNLMPQEKPSCIGINYFDVCKGAYGECKEDAIIAMNGIKSVLYEGKSSFNFEYSCDSPDERQWFRMIVTPVRSDSKLGAVVMHLNVTEKVLAEERVKLEARKYQLLFDKNPNPMWLIDAESFEILDVNDASIEQYGFSRDEFIGMNLKDIRPKEYLHQLIDVQEILKGDAVYHGIVKHSTKSGELIDVEIRSQLIVIEGKRCRLASGINVTKRIEFENRINEHNLLLESAQRIGNMAIWQYDMKTKILNLPEETLKLLGIKGDDLKMTLDDYSDYVIIDDQSRFLSMHENSNFQNEPIELEYRILDSNGEIKWIKELSRIETDEEGNPSRRLGMVMNITQRKFRETALKESQEDFKKIAEAMSEVFWISTPDYQKLYYVSPAFEDIWGFPADLVCQDSKKWLDSIHEEDLPHVLQSMKLDKTKRIPIRYRIRNSKGEIRWIHDKSPLNFLLSLRLIN